MVFHVKWVANRGLAFSNFQGEKEGGRVGEGGKGEREGSQGGEHMDHFYVPPF